MEEGIKIKGDGIGVALLGILLLIYKIIGTILLVAILIIAFPFIMIYDMIKRLIN